MTNYNEMTKKDLAALAAEREIELKSKATKATIIEALEGFDAAAQPKAKKQRPSTKEIIREMFPQVGDEWPVQDVIDHVLSQHQVAPATVGTMVGDLKNPKYCGPKGLLVLDKRSGKDGPVYVRVEAS